ncbi:MAG: tRNA dihydrouridine synthase DusB [Bacteroides sp.]|nr:tRNA dihydrouridine synthase DusB [Prevotella sp.]MCM1407999.1 tRNA dihydrouridine synthase DusB [Treponema brennaborense]MCM1468975.1 tRNA dihydrouridine synthase DusB [Bacteroides sp.]
MYHPVKIDALELRGNIFLAPVAGYSDRAFRAVCLEGGADFTFTEMVSGEALVRKSEKTLTLMRRAPEESKYAVQIFGGSPEVMEQAAAIVIETAAPSAIDVNAGCPVPKIVKTGAGSALTRDPDRLFDVVSAVCRAANGCNVPVTVKLRSGWDSGNMSWKEAACAAVEAGAAAVTLHPRTRAQGYDGKADWSVLAELVRLFHARPKPIPVFGSGDVFSPQDAARMLAETGCDAIMFARGAMGNPFVFRQTQQLLQTGEYKEIPIDVRIRAGMKELRLLAADKGELSACREMRKRFCAYVKGVNGVAQIRSDIVRASCIADYERIFAGLLLSN